MVTTAPAATWLRGRLNPGLRLHALLRHERHALLVLTSRAGDAALEGLVGYLTRRFSTWLRVEVLAPAQGDATPLTSAIAGEGDDAALSYRAAEGDVCCLIRPDGYLAMRGRFTDAPALPAALVEYLS